MAVSLVDRDAFTFCPLGRDISLSVPKEQFGVESSRDESAMALAYAGSMNETIFVKDLVLHAYHGVMRHEAKVGQIFRLDLVLQVDIATALRTDKLKDTVDYDLVVKTAARAFCERRYQLVEAAAGSVAKALLEKCPGIQVVIVTVHKPHAPIAANVGDVGVTVRRARV